MKQARPSRLHVSILSVDFMQCYQPFFFLFKLTPESSSLLFQLIVKLLPSTLWPSPPTPAPKDHCLFLRSNVCPDHLLKKWTPPCTHTDFRHSLIQYFSLNSSLWNFSVIISFVHWFLCLSFPLKYKLYELILIYSCKPSG